MASGSELGGPVDRQQLVQLTLNVLVGSSHHQAGAPGPEKYQIVSLGLDRCRRPILPQQTRRDAVCCLVLRDLSANRPCFDALCSFLRGAVSAWDHRGLFAPTPSQLQALFYHVPLHLHRAGYVSGVSLPYHEFCFYRFRSFYSQILASSQLVSRPLPAPLLLFRILLEYLFRGERPGRLWTGQISFEARINLPAPTIKRIVCRLEARFSFVNLQYLHLKHWPLNLDCALFRIWFAVHRLAIFALLPSVS